MRNPFKPKKPSLAEARQRIDAYRTRSYEDAQALLAYAKGAKRTAGKAGRKIHDEIVTAIYAQHLRSPQVARLQKKHRIGLSYHAMMVRQWKLTNESLVAGVRRPEGLLVQKRWGKAFAAELGLPTAKVYAEGVPLDQMRVVPGTVLKPTGGSGSKGVFLVRSLEEFVEVKTGTTFRSFDEVLARAAEIRLRDAETWTMEQLLVGPNGEFPAHDLKIYAFYGRVELLREDAREDGVLRRRWYNRKGERIDGIRDNEIPIEGTGIEPGWIPFVESVSLEIPAPFYRIDTFITDQGLYFGEFTPRPGGFQDYSRETDTLLGAQHLAAEGRLYADMFNGKPFAAYRRVLAAANASGQDLPSPEPSVDPLR